MLRAQLETANPGEHLSKADQTQIVGRLLYVRRQVSYVSNHVDLRVSFLMDSFLTAAAISIIVSEKGSESQA